MGTLRDELRQRIPQLHDALEQSWERAYDGWLASIPAKLDSFNSYPHLRNLENHLERIVSAHYAHYGDDFQPLLTPPELYVVLSSILFHDIGRAVSVGRHGGASARIVKTRYADLGIPSQALADSIAKICRFHDLPPRYASAELHELATTSVDPYGSIRIRNLAALLTLLDHMDGTVRRAVPDEIRRLNETELVGAFRKVVRDVVVDLEGQFVKVVLGEVFAHPDPHEGQFAQYATHLDPGTPGPYAHLQTTVLTADGKDPVLNARLVASAEFVASQGTWKRIGQSAGPRPVILDAAQINSLTNNGMITMAEARELQAQARSGTVNTASPDYQHLVIPDGSPSWPPWLLLGMILKDTRENAVAIHPITETLASMGLPVRAWLIEHNDRLYTPAGRQTHEPLLTTKQLEDTAMAMWHLSTTVFGESTFTFGTLSSALRDPDIRRVRRAVRRLGVLTDGSVWCDTTTWRWTRTTNGTGACRFLGIDPVLERIRKLGSPRERDWPCDHSPVSPR